MTELLIVLGSDQVDGDLTILQYTVLVYYSIPIVPTTNTSNLLIILLLGGILLDSPATELLREATKSL